MKFLLLALLAGLVSALGFEPLRLWPLTLAAFAGLMWLVARAPSLRSALGLGYWFGVGNFVLGLNWIATAFQFQSAMPVWLGWIAVLLLSLYLAVYPAMAAGLAWRYGRGAIAAPLAPFRRPDHPHRDPDHPRHPDHPHRDPDHPHRDPDHPHRDPDHPHRHPGLDPGSTLNGVWSGDERWMPDRARHDGEGGTVAFVLVFAAAWIVAEWLRATMFTGFAWNPIGVALLPTPIAKLAIWTGTYGLSGIAMLIAGGLLLLFGRERERAGIMLGTLVLAGAAAWLLHAETLPAPRTPIRIVQPNIGQETKWSEGFTERSLVRLGKLSNAGAEPRLLLWPEAAITEPLEDGRALVPYQRDVVWVRNLIRRQLGPRDLLLTGGITIQSANGLDATSATNSVFAIDGRGRILSRYDKAHLVPYGEYLPMRTLLEPLGLSRLAPGSLDFDPGPGPKTLKLPLVGEAGFQLCYEIIFSGQVVNDANRPAFLFNPSNDAWFGAWGPPQHLAQARLRALEEGLPVLRSTPTGISAVIDADGELLHSIPWKTAGFIDAVLPAPKPPTLFSRMGNILPFLLALLLAAIAIAVRRKAG